MLYSPIHNGERAWLVSAFSVMLPPPATWEIVGRTLVGKDADGEKLDTAPLLAELMGILRPAKAAQKGADG